MIDVMLRADSRVTLETAMEMFGLLVMEDGALVPARGIAMHWDIPVVLSPAVISGDAVVTLPTLDPRCHVNLRIAPPASESLHDGRITKVAYIQQLWRDHGAVAGQSNASETALVYQGVEWIDPLTVVTPAHRFSGSLTPL